MVRRCKVCAFVRNGGRNVMARFGQNNMPNYYVHMMSLRSQMMRSWKIISGNANGDFRLYDRSLTGVDYICKCLGANAYEINKGLHRRRNDAVGFSHLSCQGAGCKERQTLL